LQGEVKLCRIFMLSSAIAQVSPTISCPMFVPGFDGAVVTPARSDALWIGFFAGAPPRRGGPSRDPAQSGEPEGAGQALRHRPEHRVRRGRHALPSSVGVPGRRSRIRPCCRSEEAIVVAFRRHTPLPLDDGLSARQATVAHLAASCPELPAARSRAHSGLGSQATCASACA
jgi:hypothetical protein